MNLEAIYAHLPETTCPPDCGVCCEHAQPFVSRRERKAIQHYCAAHQIPFVKFVIDFHRPRPCPYLKDHRCLIHEARPFFCRVVGSVQGRECSKCTCEKLLPFDRANDLFLLLFEAKGERKRTAEHFTWLEHEVGRKIYA